MPPRSMSQPLYTFDSSDWATPEAYERWQDMIGVTHEVETATPDLSTFRARSAHWQFPDFMYGWASFSPMNTRRADQHIRRDHIDHYWLFAQGPGSGISQTEAFTGRTVFGDLQFLDHAQPDFGISSHGVGVTVFIPRDVLDQALPGVADLHGTFLTDERAKHLCSLLVNLPAFLPELPDEAVPGLVNAIVASIVDSLASRMAFPTPSERRMRPLREAIEHHIRNHLDDPDLSIATLCATFDVSRATLYRLFDRDEGIARYIRRERLIAIHQRLRAGTDERPLAEIAAAFGFDHDATFRMHFQQEFGYLPRDARNASRQADSAAASAFRGIFHGFDRKRDTLPDT
ncbi:MAG: helix-turn-helix domain-containing protein [Thermomicrobiales bacterium]